MVERIASDLSAAAGKLYRIGRDGEEQELDEHAFLDFWDNPNPLHEMSNAALWRLLEIYLALKGEGYFIIEKDIFGRPVELWPVPVHWVQMTLTWTTRFTLSVPPPGRSCRCLLMICS